MRRSLRDNIVKTVFDDIGPTSVAGTGLGDGGDEVQRGRGAAAAGPRRVLAGVLGLGLDHVDGGDGGGLGLLLVPALHPLDGEVQAARGRAGGGGVGRRGAERREVEGARRPQRSVRQRPAPAAR